jgi:hypothetical protein
MRYTSRSVLYRAQNAKVFPFLASPDSLHDWLCMMRPDRKFRSAIHVPTGIDACVTLFTRSVLKSGNFDRNCRDNRVLWLRGDMVVGQNVELWD